MILLRIAIKAVCLMLFCLLSVFVILFGKGGTDIKGHYFITSVFLLGVILFL